MKTIYTLIITGVLGLALQFTGITNSLTPPPAHTGAPGEATCNTSGCHTGTINSGPGSIRFASHPKTYRPGNYTWSIWIRVTDPSKSRFGFQLTALDSAGNKQGNFILVSPGTTSIQNSGNRQYLSHQNPNLYADWHFNWQSPATNVGPVTFYMAGIAGNNDNSASGDHTYTETYVMHPATTTGILDPEFSNLVSVYPNPADDRLFITGAALAQASGLQIFDINGRLIRKVPAIPQAIDLEINISDLTSGVYLLHFETTEGQQITRKFLVK